MCAARDATAGGKKEPGPRPASARPGAGHAGDDGGAQNVMNPPT